MTTANTLRAVRISTLACLCLAALAACFTTVHAQPPDDRPNLMLLLSDDISANEFSFLTDRARESLNGAVTPTLDRLRREGVAFRTAWSQAICGPTRGSLVTGLYGQITGWFDNRSKPKGEENALGNKFGTFGLLAQAAGYKVLISGKWQMVGSVKPYGYDEACLWRTSDDPDVRRGDIFLNYDGPANPETGQQPRYWHGLFIANGTLIPTNPLAYGPNIIMECTMNFISRQVAAGNKYLIYMPLLLPHVGYDQDRNKTNVYVPVPRVDDDGNILGKERGRGTMKRSVEYQDYLVGRLMDHVEDLGQKNNTITFFVGDNGTEDYGKLQNVTETATRVPFVVHGPGRVQPRRLSKQLVATNDVYNTLRSFLEASIPDGQLPRPQSVNIAPYLLGETQQIQRKWLYGVFEEKRWIRDKTFIYDGNQDFWQCPTRDERSCQFLSPPMAQKAERRLRQFQKILCLLEAGENPDPNSLRQRMAC